MRLAGKVAIITGAASGMGEAEARLFAREGAQVVLSDITDDLANAVAASINEDGGDALFVHADVSSEDDWRDLVAQTLGKYGKIDILVNNAGIASSYFQDFDDTAGWHKLMEVNAGSCFLGTKLCVPEMRKQGGGAIVNTSSFNGLVGSSRGHPGYHASKGAVMLYTRAAAARYGVDNIRVNCLHPGTMQRMRTARPLSGHDTDIRAHNEALRPLKRIGTPEDVAYAALFLASDEASYITGASLPVDGGFTAV